MNNYLLLDENSNPVPECYTILMLVVVHSSSPDGAAHSVSAVGPGATPLPSDFDRKTIKPCSNQWSLFLPCFY